MSIHWQVIESGPMSAQAIMDKDFFLLTQLQTHSQPILHLYEWEKPSLTYGYFTHPEQHLSMADVERLGLDIAHRPTGGGIIFHLTDFSFSILLPAHHPKLSINSLENYHSINSEVAKILDHFTSHPPTHLDLQPSSCKNPACHTFCMATPTEYDLLINGKKVGGAAQRRTKNGLLHQGSISLSFPPIDILNQIIVNNKEVVKAMEENTFCLLQEGATSIDVVNTRLRLHQFFKNAIHSSDIADGL